MNCAGSVGLLKDLHIEQDSDEPEYRSLGTSAHKTADTCLKTGAEAWELINQEMGKHKVDAEMATAVQVYLDEITAIKTANPGGKEYIEYGIDYAEFHKDFYGTLDWGYVVNKKLWVRDYKHGEGVAVEVEDNPQIKYYAFGLLRHHPEVTDVDLGIVQPRIVYLDPVRTWETTGNDIRTWAERELKPAMERTALDNDLDAGAWCRFCPAKLVCPLMWSLFGAAMQTDPKQVVNLTPDIFGKSYQYLAPLKSFVAAFEAEAFNRLNRGDKIPEIKMVEKKSNRVFKAGADQIFVPKYGSEAYTKPALKGPAEMEKLGEAAKVLVKEWAYKPHTGLTVALATDRRPEILNVRPSETFSGLATDRRPEILNVRPSETFSGPYHGSHGSEDRTVSA
jgi:hypothetical protein